MKRGNEFAVGLAIVAALAMVVAGALWLSETDVNVVDVQQGLLPAVISGRADAMLGGFLNVEGVDLRLRGLHPRVVPVDRLGVPTYDELVDLTRRQARRFRPGENGASVAR